MKYIGLFCRCITWRKFFVLLGAVIFSGAAAAQANAKIESRQSSLLTHGTNLTGGWLGGALDPVQGPHVASIPAGFISWQMPSVISGRGDFLYVVDGGRRQIFRFDTVRQALTKFGSCSACDGTSIAVARDLSLYVADSSSRQVQRFAADGRKLQTFSNEYELTSPVAVLLEEPGGKLYVADGIYNHVVVFNSLGRVLQVLKPSQGRSIVAMALGPDGLYLVDRLGAQVVVMGQDGSDRYTLGKGELKMPIAIAVDRFNRVFVSDIFDNSIKIFENGELVGRVSASGVVPASFNRITSLTLEQNILYLADSLNRRILSFHVSPAFPVAPARARSE